MGDGVHTMSLEHAANRALSAHIHSSTRATCLASSSRCTLAQPIDASEIHNVPALYTEVSKVSEAIDASNAYDDPAACTRFS